MRRPLILSALVLALAACNPSPDASTPATGTSTRIDTAAETERLNAWFEEKYEERLLQSPLQLTFLGRRERQDELDDMSEQAALDQLAWQAATVEELTANFDYDALTDEARLSWDLWVLQYENARAGIEFLRNGYVFDQMSGPQSFLPTILINFHRVETEADYLAYVSRLQAFPRVFEQLLTHARSSVEAGIRAPRFAYLGVIEQANNVISGAPFTDGADSALWGDLQAKAAALVEQELITAERGEELTALARTALIEHVQPAYAGLIAWAETDIADAVENPSGVGSTQPNGAAYYEHQLRQMTTTDLSADEIHAIGLREVERIHGEMNALRERVGFDGDLEAFFEFIATDPRFVFPDTDEGRQAYLDRSSELIENIKRHLPEFFGLLPKADLVVRRVEAFREQDGAAQHYFPGTPDGSRPGIYYAHLSDMKAMPIPELEVIAYHEGLPGHHMQISIAQELTGVPTFRTQAGFTAYAEGWGLYAEWLATEIPGTYEDPYSEFGRLSSELWRAVRLVVDTGLHAQGWTEQQAVDYFDGNSSVPLAAIRSEIQRYLVMPGQATAYKIGMIRIQELRRQAEQELGDAFDIRAFHDAVLGGGALPLNLLERRVAQWIAEVKSQG